jgi:cytochrome P450
MNANLDSIFTSLLDPALNDFQAWALQHPEEDLSKALIPIISFVEGLLANEPTYLASKRREFGPNFCCAGQVVMGEFETLEAALTSPQARTWRLGTTVLDPDRAPNQDIGGRNVFLLSLSDEAAGGSNDHAAFRQCMQHYLLNDAASERQKDAIARRLLEQLAEDYKAMPHGSGGAFFTDDKRGLMQFMIRYLHYVLFGLNPDDDASMKLLTELHYTHLSTLHYMDIVGSLLQNLNIKGHGDLSNSIEQAATIYENSPALADFQEEQPEYNRMTRRELAKLMTSIMSIAALQGPLHLAYTSMGFRPLPAYLDRQTAHINPTHYWDALNLDDREAVQRFLLECARLWAPVSATHRVATEPFTLTVAGKEHTFPAGTKILIPMSLGLLDERFWGPTTYEFDAQRENLCPFHMGFHGVGDRSAGRICPGKDLALDMLVDMLVIVGKVRRALPTAATTGSTADHKKDEAT